MHKIVRYLVLSFVCFLNTYLLRAGEGENGSTLTAENELTIRVDTQAPPSKQPIVDSSSHVTIIDITTPSSDGVSHNIFQKYNVPPQGVVFNNNSTHDPCILEADLICSQLTKTPLLINEQLHHGSADVILTEVSGVNPSKLVGPTEIYGHSADFILANPQGIYCNGCGFINASHITLTTGLPQLDRSGNLQGFEIRQGTIEIAGEGIRTTLDDVPQSPLDILTRAAKISTTLWSKDAIRIYTGPNHVSYKDKTVTPHPSWVQDTPVLAIDASLISDVNAGKITIISTEEGVGVHCGNLTASSGDITITADGTISLENVDATQCVTLQSQSGDIRQEGDKMWARDKLTLQAPQGDIHLRKGQINAQGLMRFTSHNFTLFPQVILAQSSGSPASLHFHIRHTCINDGKILAPTLTATMANFCNNGLVATQQDLSLTTTQSLTNRGELRSRQGSTTLQTKALHNEQTIASAQSLTINTPDRTNQGELVGGAPCPLSSVCIDNDGILSSKQTLLLTAARLTNGGTLQAQGDVTLQLQEDLTNHGALLSREGSTTITPLDPDNSSLSVLNEGKLLSKQALSLTAGHLTNSGTLGANRDVTLYLQEALTNRGELRSTQGSTTLQTKALHNEQTIASAQSLTINTPDRTNQGELVGGAPCPLSSVCIDNDGILSSKQTLLLTAARLTNGGTLQAQGDVTLQLQEDLTNHGALLSREGSTTITPLDPDNSSLSVLNEGQLLSKQALSLTAGHLTNSGILGANRDVTLYLQEALTNRGELLSTQGSTTLQTKALHNEQTIASAQSLTINTPDRTNQGELVGGAPCPLSSVCIDNAGILSSKQTLFLTAARLTNGGTLQAQGDVTLQLQEDLTNHGALLSREGSTTITPLDPDNSSLSVLNEGQLLSKQALSLTAGHLTNSGILGANRDVTLYLQEALTNRGELLSTQGSTTLQTKALHNEQKIASAQSLTINTPDLTSSGELVGGDNVTLSSVCIDNAGTLSGEKVLLLTAARLTNGGTLQAQGDVTLHLQEDLTNRGELLSREGSTTITPLDPAHAALSVLNKGKLFSGQAFTLTAAHLTNDGTLSASDDVTLQLQEDLTNSGELLSTQGSATLTPLDPDNFSLSVLNEGKLFSDQAFTLTAAHLTNDGTLSANDDVTLQLQEDLTNHGALLSREGSTTITPLDPDNSSLSVLNEGQLLSKQALSLTAGHLTNSGILGANRDVTLYLQEALTNRGELLSTQGSTTLQTKALHNEQKIASAQSLTINAPDLTSRGELVGGDNVTLSSVCIDNAGTLSGEKVLLLTAARLTNGGTLQAQGDVTLHLQEDLTNRGTLLSREGSTTITPLDPDNSSLSVLNEGKLFSKQALSLTAGHLTNSGTLGTNDDVTLHLQEDLTNRGELLSREGSTTITPLDPDNSSLSVLNEGQLFSGQAFTLTAAHLTNDGTLSANDDVTLHLQEDLTNRSALLSREGSTTITPLDPAHAALSVLNKGKLFSGQAFTLTAAHLTNDGTLSANDDVTLQLQEDLTNSGELLSTQGSATLTPLDPDNFSLSVLNEGKLFSDQAFTLTAAHLTNDGTLSANDDVTLQLQEDLTNHGALLSREGSTTITPLDPDNSSLSVLNEGQLLSKQALSLTAGHLTNSGILGANRDVTLYLQEALTNRGELLSTQGSTTLQTKALHNEQKIASAQSLTINAPDLTSRGELVGGDNVTLSSVCIDNAGTLSGEKVLLLTAARLTNGGTLQAQGDVTLHLQEDLTNRGTLLSREGSTTITPLDPDNSSLSVLNEGKLFSKQALSLTAGHLTNSGTLGTNDDVTLHLQEDLTNRGELLSREGSTTITPLDPDNSSLSVLNEGQLFSGQAFTLTAAHLTNDGTLSANDDVTLHLQEDLTNRSALLSREGSTTITPLDPAHAALSVLNKGKLFSGQAFTLTAAHLTNDGTLSANDDVTLQLQEDLTNSGELLSTQGSATLTPLDPDNFSLSVLNEGKLFSDQAFTLTAAHLTNDGTLSANDDVTLQLQEDLTNHGALLSREGSTTITPLDPDNSSLSVLNEGQLLSKQALSLTAGHLTNSGTLGANRDVTLYLQEALTNRGELLSTQGSTTLQTKALHNEQKIASAQSLTINAPDLTSSGELVGGDNVTLSSVCIDNAGTLSGEKVLLLTAARLTNGGTLQAQGDVTLHLQEDLTNRGALLSREGSTTITPLDPDNSSLSVLNEGKLFSKQALSLTAGHLTNSGTLGTNDDVTLHLQEDLTNRGELLSREGSTTITPLDPDNSSLSVLNEGQLFSGQAFTLTAAHLTNDGTLSANDDVTLHLQEDLTNRSALLSREGSTTITPLDPAHAALSVLNEGQLFSGQAFTLTAAHLTNDGTLSANDDVTLQLQEDLTNSGELLSTQGSATLTPLDPYNFSLSVLNEGQLLSKQALSLTAGHLTNSGILGANRDVTLYLQEALTNRGELLSTQGSTTLQTKALHNEQKIASAQSLTINAPDLTSRGELVGGDNVTLSSVCIDNAGTLSGEKVLLLTAARLTNGGTLQAQGDVTLHLQEDLTNRGALLSREGSTTITPLDPDNSSLSVLNEGKLFSKQALSLTAGHLTNSGTLGTNDDVTLHLQEDLTNRGELLSREGSTTITPLDPDNSSLSVLNEGQLFSGQAFTLTAAHLTNDGTLSANDDVTLHLQEDLTNRSALLSREGSTTITPLDPAHAALSVLNEGQLFSGQAFTLTAAHLTNDGTLSANDDVTLQLQEDLTNSGELLSTQGSATLTPLDPYNFSLSVLNEGQLLSKQALSLTAGHLTNSGTLGANDDVTLYLQEALTNRGELFSRQGSTTLQTKALHNEQKIASAQSLTINAPDLTSRGELVGGDNVTLSSVCVENYGNVSSDQALSLTAHELKNAGTLQAHGDVTLYLQEALTNRGALLSREGSTTITPLDPYNSSLSVLNEDQLFSKQALSLTAARLTNGGNLQAHSDVTLQLQEDLINHGALRSREGSTTITPLDPYNSSLSVLNEGQLFSDQVFSLTAARLTNGDTLQAQGDVTLHLQEDLTNHGALLSREGSTTITPLDPDNFSLSVLNEGQLFSKQALSLTAGHLTNSGILGANRDVTLYLQEALTNRGELRSRQGSTTMNALDPNNHSFSVENAGILSSTQRLSLHAKQLTNQGHLWGDTKITLKVDHTLTNAGEISSKNGTTVVNTKILDNCQVIRSGHDLQLATQALCNQGDIIGGAGSTTITSDGLLDNQKTITCANKLHITGKELRNYGSISGGKGSTTLEAHTIQNRKAITSIKHLSVTADSFSNFQGGQVAANHNLTLCGRRRIANNGQITGGEGITTIRASEIDNYCVLTSVGHLDLITQRLKNNGQVAANHNLTLCGRRIANRGDIIGGAGSTTIKFDGLLVNQKTIACANKLHITGKELRNYGSISGGQDSTTLEAHTIQNRKAITSTKHLSVTAKAFSNFQGGQVAANHNLTLRGRRIYNNGHITGGAGSTTIQASEIDNYCVLTSVGHLDLTTERLKNNGQVATNHNLTLCGRRRIVNNGQITGGEGSTTIQGSEIDNQCVLTSAGHLDLTTEGLENNGQVVANHNLTITAHKVVNHCAKLIFAGQAMTMQVADSIYNDQGDILSQGSMLLEGQTQLVKKISNKVGTIEARGGMTIKAENLYNIGHVEDKGYTLIHKDTDVATEIYQPQSTWQHVRGEIKTPSDIPFRLIQETEVVSKMKATPARISSQANLSLYVTGDICNLSSSITAGQELTIQGGGAIKSEPFSHTVHLPEGKTYRKFWSETRTTKLLFIIIDRTKSDHESVYTAPQEVVVVASPGAILDGYQSVSLTVNKLANTLSTPPTIDEVAISYNTTPIDAVKLTHTIRPEAIKLPTGSHGLFKLNPTLAPSSCPQASSPPAGVFPSPAVPDLPQPSASPVVSAASQEGMVDKKHKFDTKPFDFSQSTSTPTSSLPLGTDSDITKPSASAASQEGKECKFDTKPFDFSQSTSTPTSSLPIGTAPDLPQPSDAAASQEGKECKFDTKPFDFSQPTPTPTSSLPLDTAPDLPQPSDAAASQEGKECKFDTKPFDFSQPTPTPTSSLPLDTAPDLPQPSDAAASQEGKECKFDTKPFDFSQPTSTPTSSLPIGTAPDLPQPSDAAASQEGKECKFDTKPFDFSQPTPTPTSSLPLDTAPDLPQPSASAASQEGQECNFDTKPVDFPQDTTPPTTLHQDTFVPPMPERATFPSPPPYTCLVQTNVNVMDQKQFYGCDYFLKKVGIHNEKPLVFLGNPPYEKQLVEEAVFQATGRSFLRSDIATAAEQSKYLIDNTAEVAKDLHLAMGVTLTKAQIENLQQDIMWYVERDVEGYKVLVPQIYLSQHTVDQLDRLHPGSTIHSHGTTHIDSEEGLTNTGTIVGQEGLHIKAKSIKNQTLGSCSATIQSKKATLLEAAHTIHNQSGVIQGGQHVGLVAQEIHHQTQLQDTLKPQASIASGGSLEMKAENDIHNRASSITAKGDALLKAGGNIHYHTQQLHNKTQQSTSSSSHSSGFVSSRSTYHQKGSIHEENKHAACDVNIQGSLEQTSGKDLQTEATRFQVGGDHTMEAGGKIHATDVHDTQTTTDYERRHSSSSGLFSSKSSGSGYETSTTTKQSRGNAFTTGGKLIQKAQGDIMHQGSHVTAKEASLEAGGNLTVKAGYNETKTTHHDDSHRHKSTFSLFKNKQGQQSSTVDQKQQAAGNQWAIQNSLSMHAQGKAHTQAIQVTARSATIQGEQGTTDTSLELAQHRSRHQDSYKHRSGLLGLSFDASQGRAGLKLHEKDHFSDQQASTGSVAQESCFTIAENLDFASEQGKVLLKGTNSKVGGTLRLSGKEGVTVCDHLTTTSGQERHTHQHSEGSIGIKNKFIASIHEAHQLKAAKDQLVQAQRSYHSYKEQLSQAASQREKGLISAADYASMKSEEAQHLTAMLLASTNVVAQTQHFTHTVAAAAACSNTLGMSLDLQLSVDKTMEQLLSQEVQAKVADLQAQNIVIETDQTALLQGKLKAKDTVSISAAQLTTCSSSSTKQTTHKQASNQGNTTVDLSVRGLSCEGVTLSAYKRATDGRGEETQPQQSQLDSQTLKLNIQKDTDLGGIQVTTQHLEGTVGGDFILSSVQDTKDAHSTTQGIGSSVGVSPDALQAGLSGELSTTKERGRWTQCPSSLRSHTSSLHIGGKIINRGACFDPGQGTVSAQDYYAEDLFDYDRRSTVGGSASISLCQPLGSQSSTRQQHGFANGAAGHFTQPLNSLGGHFQQERTLRKTRASLGADVNLQLASPGAQEPLAHANRDTHTPQIDIQSTHVGMQANTQTMKTLLHPGKTLQKLARDAKTMGQMGIGVVSALANARKTGVQGTALAVEIGLSVPARTAKALEEVANNNLPDPAAAETSEALEGSLNRLAHHHQGGATKSSDVRIYEGDALKGSGVCKYQSYFDPRGYIGYNISGKGSLDADQVYKRLFHEVTHQEVRNKLLGRKLSSTQEEHLATFAGNLAGKTCKNSCQSSSAESSYLPSKGDAFLAQRNKEAASIDAKTVKPLLLEHLDANYRQALQAGDFKKAAEIKAKWENREDWIPVLGPAKDLQHNLEQGQYFRALGNSVLLGIEMSGLGLGRKIATKTAGQLFVIQTAKKTTEQGVKQTAKVATEQVAKQLTRDGILEVAKKTTKQTGIQLTNEQLVQKAAKLANKAIPGKGRVVGTYRHTYATRLLERHKKLFGDRGMKFNHSFKDLATGLRGRLDVWDPKNKIIYDWKFGNAIMSKKQYYKYWNKFKHPIKIIKP